MLIYTPFQTRRINYIFKIYFSNLLGIDFNITCDKDTFINFDGVKISYAEQPLSNEIFFSSTNILFEETIHQIDIQFTEFDNILVPFAVNNKKSAFPFDPFAAGFYLISRYEEYLPYIKDQHERFSPNQSLAFRNYFLKKPVINIWAQNIEEKIKSFYPNFKTKKKEFTFVPTIDIDSAYAYRLKGIIRSIGGYLKSLKKFDFSEIIERTKVLTGLSNDYFDTYSNLSFIHQKYNLRPIFFILFARYGTFDKNIPINNQKFHSLIKMLDDEADVGIHPSYASNSNINILKEEINNLSNVLNRPITKSRQHFLKLSMPQTYRNLLELGITDDYTMGYASEIGFRASIASPFNFYDLEMDIETNLIIHPFAFMEGTLRDYHNKDANSAKPIIYSLIDEVKKVNGTFISLWHNESLCNKKRWVGWDQLYNDMIEYALY
jgi:hypothetical protein